MNDWISQRFASFGDKSVAIDADGSVSYAELNLKVEYWAVMLEQWQVSAGDRVALICDFDIEVVALLMALLAQGCIIIPLAEDDRSLFEERLDTCSATKLITIDHSVPINSDSVLCQDCESGAKPMHDLMAPMSNDGKPGFVIFTSGSTGKGKGVLLDFARMTKKFVDKVRPAFKTLLFLKLDHIGGLNTLFSVLLNGGTIVTSPSRQANDICQCIETNQVELLPTTPSFLTMLLMSRMYENYDLSSLKVVTYGTEVMPASTLSGMNKIFPELILKQTYGLSELGILSTKSKDSQSKWMKIGGAGFDLKVIDDVLWIKSESAMLGYLNAPSPFDEDGWYNTGDKVEVDGEYFKILGRESEIINVAGEKVFPIEIESFLLTLDNIKEAVVRAKKSPVTGQMVWAECVLEQEEEKAEFKKRVLKACQEYFPPFKVPGLITLSKSDNVMGNRFKKIRKV